MDPPSWLRFIRRPFPSANSVVIASSRPVLVDTGYGSDLEATEQLIVKQGVNPARLSLVVNTHHHCDHVGGNAGLQRMYGVSVAAHRWEAELINRRDPEACVAEWLDQPIEPYRVNASLSDGDIVDAGDIQFLVIHTPGHTLGHLSLYEPEERMLILGDAVHVDDVAWINPYREGVGALVRAMESIERLAGLGARWACSGHGPAIEEPPRAFAAARERYLRWLEKPESAAWHACKRIAAYALIIRGGIPKEEVLGYFASRPWMIDFARGTFATEPDDFARALLDELMRSGAARRRDGRLVATVPYAEPPLGWRIERPWPRQWPSLELEGKRLSENI